MTATDPDELAEATVDHTGSLVEGGLRDDGVVIEVVLNRDGTVWTAYPLSGDGVVFNNLVGNSYAGGGLHGAGA